MTCSMILALALSVVLPAVPLLLRRARGAKAQGSCLGVLSLLFSAGGGLKAIHSDLLRGSSNGCVLSAWNTWTGSWWQRAKRAW